LPFVTVDNTRLFYRLEGRSDRPVLVLSHSIGTDHGLWDRQTSDLLPYFQILRYDTRGLGTSDAPAGDYSMARLGLDVLAMADTLGIERFAFCGLSLGGMIGQWLGAHASDRLTHLILANTSPNAGPASNWDARKRTVADQGMAPLTDLFLQRSFSSKDRVRDDPHAASLLRTFLATNPTGYSGCCSAIRDMDHVSMLRDIRVPTMIVSGDRDVSTPWDGHADILAREIYDARVVHLPAAHLSNIEQPRSFTAALLDFLVPTEYGDPMQTGDRVRRAVLGDAHVDAAMARTNDFTRAFQDLITRYAWGTVWARPGLDTRTRRLLALVLTAALGRQEEFRLHIRTGLAADLEPCDVREALLVTAIYAGIPAANAAFRVAREEIEKR
jgi:3-oxoadipate enol-lactonase/4-carboxymuconolactone decarboxylase